jgi:hypothetical protein
LFEVTSLWCFTSSLPICSHDIVLRHSGSFTFCLYMRQCCWQKTWWCFYYIKSRYSISRYIGLSGLRKFCDVNRIVAFQNSTVSNRPGRYGIIKCFCKHQSELRSWSCNVSDIFGIYPVRVWTDSPGFHTSPISPCIIIRAVLPN